MPGENQEIVRLGVSGLGLGDDGNTGAWCSASPFLGIFIGGGYYGSIVDAEELQEDVSLGRCAVEVDGFSLCLFGVQEVTECILCIEHSPRELTVGAFGVECRAFFIEEGSVYSLVVHCV